MTAFHPKHALIHAVVLATGLTACSIDRSIPPTVRDVRNPTFVLSDARNNNGNQHFFFLPPLVPNPNAIGTFDPSLRPAVEICEWSSSCTTVVARFTMESGDASDDVRLDAGNENYIVNWDTKACLTGACSLDPSKMYRIRVLVAGVELGFADVDVVASGSELKNVQTAEYIALLNGRTLPIKFRIEVGAVSVIGPDGGTLTFSEGCFSLSVPPGALQSEVGITAEAQATPSGTTSARLVEGMVLRMSPEGTQLAMPATLSVCYNPSNIPAGRSASSLRLYERSSDAWEFLVGGSVNTATHVVSAPITRLGVYSVQSMRRVGMSTYSDTDSRWRIYVVYEDGSDLTLFRHDARSPAWSPDGSRIAFTHIEPGGSDSRPMVMTLSSNALIDLAGQNVQGVWATGYGTPMVWSPDGARITLNTHGGNGEPAGEGAFTNPFRWTTLASDGASVGNIRWPVRPYISITESLPDNWVSGCCAVWSLDGTHIYANFNSYLGTPSPTFTGLYRIDNDLASGLQVINAELGSRNFDIRGLTNDPNRMVILYQDLAAWNGDIPYFLGTLDLTSGNVTPILSFIDASDNGWSDGGLRDGSPTLVPDRAHISFFALGIQSVTHPDGCVWTVSLNGSGLRCVFDGSALRSIDPGLYLVPVEGWEP